MSKLISSITGIASTIWMLSAGIPGVRQFRAKLNSRSRERQEEAISKRVNQMSREAMLSDVDHEYKQLTSAQRKLARHLVKTNGSPSYSLGDITADDS